MDRTRRWATRLVALASALVVVRLLVPWWCGRDAERWLSGDPEIQHELAAELIAFETRPPATGADRFTGEWALVTHQMMCVLPAPRSR